MQIIGNKVVWITGASSGIGEQLALQLAARGAKIVLSSRSETELMRVKNSCKLSDERILILPLDLSNTTEVSEQTKKVIEKFGRIDILINNGGISQRSQATETPIAIDRKIMEVNFFGTVALTKSVLPEMIKQNSGQIVVISSVAGKFGFYLRSAYSASKHALHGFFESMRMEVGKYKIGVLIICPGKIQTNISVNAIKGDGTKHGQMDESQAKGITVADCATQIINAIIKEKEEIYIGQAKERFALWMKRIFPSIFSKQIKKQKPE
jgi:short-subunit dehydrogenase